MNLADPYRELQDPVEAKRSADRALRENVERYLGYVVPPDREVTREEYDAVRAKQGKPEAEMTEAERRELDEKQRACIERLERRDEKRRQRMARKEARLRAKLESIGMLAFRSEQERDQAVAEMKRQIEEQGERFDVTPWEKFQYRDTPAEQQRQFREESKAIGEGKSGAHLPPHFASLDEMVEQAIFIADGSWVTLRSDPRIAWAFPDFKNLTKAYTVQTGLQGRPLLLANAWLQHPRRPTVHTRTFLAGGPLFCRSPDDHPAVNTWREPARVPPPQDWQERSEPFFEHVRFLAPDATERDLLLDWLAHIEQRPGELPHVHFLMFTAMQGVGRNLLAAVLARVWPGTVALDVDLPALLDGGFNGRLSRKLLAVVNEVREGAGPNQYRHADRLRTLLTDETRAINPKYGRQAVEWNSTRWLMFSNHEAAIPLDRFDRRVVVVRNPDQPRDAAYYSRLYALVRDPEFPASVREALRLRDISGFQVGMHAPLTAAKRAVIDASASEADLTMREIVKTHPADCITGSALTAQLFGLDASRAERSSIRWVAARVGATRLARRVQFDRRQEWVWILRNPEQWAAASDQAICAEIWRGLKRERKT
jgi:hypothetical protein